MENHLNQRNTQQFGIIILSKISAKSTFSILCHKPKTCGYSFSAQTQPTFSIVAISHLE